MTQSKANRTDAKQQTLQDVYRVASLTVVPLEGLDHPAKHRRPAVPVVVHRPVEHPAHKIRDEIPNKRPGRRPQGLERRPYGRQRLRHTRTQAVDRQAGRQGSGRGRGFTRCRVALLTLWLGETTIAGS